MTMRAVAADPIDFDGFVNVDIRIGTPVAVGPLAKARKPAFVPQRSDRRQLLVPGTHRTAVREGVESVASEDPGQ